jgi:hypothetical protein
MPVQMNSFTPSSRDVTQPNATDCNAARARRAAKYIRTFCRRDPLPPCGLGHGPAFSAIRNDGSGTSRGRRRKSPITNGAPGGTRTPDQRIRNPLLYPPELRARLRSNSESIPCDLEGIASVKPWLDRAPEPSTTTLHGPSAEQAPTGRTVRPGERTWGRVIPFVWR